MGRTDTWLVEVLLPLTYNTGVKIPDEIGEAIRAELAERFGGLTAFTRSPAEGVWLGGGAPQKDDIVVLEIMTEGLDASWWQNWRSRMEDLLQQDAIIVRAHEIRRL